VNVPGRKYFHGEAVYTGWIPRAGDNLILRAQVFDNGGIGVGQSISLDITVYTKNSEDLGADFDGMIVTDTTNDQVLTVTSSSTDPVALGELLVESTPGTTGSKANGLREMVRLKIVAGSTEGNASDWVLARIFPPIFFDTAIG